MSLHPGGISLGLVPKDAAIDSTGQVLAGATSSSLKGPTAPRPAAPRPPAASRYPDGAEEDAGCVSPPEDITPTTLLPTPRDGSSSICNDSEQSEAPDHRDEEQPAAATRVSASAPSAFDSRAEEQRPPLAVAGHYLPALLAALLLCKTGGTRVRVLAELPAFVPIQDMTWQAKSDEETAFSDGRSSVPTSPSTSPGEVRVAGPSAACPTPAAAEFVYVSPKALDALRGAGSAISERLEAAAQASVVEEESVPDSGLWVSEADLAIALVESVRDAEGNIVICPPVAAKEGASVQRGALNVWLGEGTWREADAEAPGEWLAYSCVFPSTPAGGLEQSAVLRAGNLCLTVKRNRFAGSATCTVTCSRQQMILGKATQEFLMALTQLELKLKERKESVALIEEVRRAVAAAQCKIWVRPLEGAPSQKAQAADTQVCLAMQPNLDQVERTSDFIEQVCMESWQLGICLCEHGGNAASTLDEYQRILATETWKRMTACPGSLCKNENDFLSRFFVPIRDPARSMHLMVHLKELLEKGPLEAEYI